MDDHDDVLTSEQIALCTCIDALGYLATHEGAAQSDAALVFNADFANSLTNMKVTGFFRACMQGNNDGVLRLAKIFSGVDVVRLADALRVEYAIRRLGGRDE